MNLFLIFVTVLAMTPPPPIPNNFEQSPSTQLPSAPQEQKLEIQNKDVNSSDPNSDLLAQQQQAKQEADMQSRNKSSVTSTNTQSDTPLLTPIKSDPSSRRVKSAAKSKEVPEKTKPTSNSESHDETSTQTTDNTSIIEPSKQGLLTLIKDSRPSSNSTASSNAILE